LNNKVGWVDAYSAGGNFYKLPSKNCCFGSTGKAILEMKALIEDFEGRG
jgi:hypothetical protein